MHDLQNPNGMRYTQYIVSLRNALDAKKIGDTLCDVLEKTGDTSNYVLLFTLYCVITFNQLVSSSFLKRVQFILQGVTKNRTANFNRTAPTYRVHSTVYQ